MIRIARQRTVSGEYADSKDTVKVAPTAPLINTVLITNAKP